MTTEKSLDDETWKSLTEQSILLNDGLKYVAHLVSAPESLPKLSSLIDLIDSDFRFEPTWIAKLAQSLQKNFSVEQDPYHLFFDLRQRSIINLWQVQQSCLHNSCNALSIDGETQSYEQTATASFTSHMSLLLLLPLLQSQAKTDPTLSVSCTSLLLNYLKECSPNSLSSEPPSCTNGLEDLLCSWIETDSKKQSASLDSAVNISKEDVIATLIALACGRFSLQSFIQIILILLQHRTSLLNIATGNLLQNAIKYIMKGQYTKPTLLQTSHFITQWHCAPFPDSLLTVKNDENCPSISSDGKYLFVTNAAGKGLAKIGTGQFGSFQGYVYSINMHMEDGWVACNGNYLLFRPKAFDDDSKLFCHILDLSSLQIKHTVTVIQFEEGFTLPAKEQVHKIVTVMFTSDGVHLYWIFTLQETTTKPAQPAQAAQQQKQEEPNFELYVCEFKLEMKKGDNNSEFVAVPVNPPVTISFNKSKKKDKPSNNSKQTAIGLSKENLFQTPMFISGNMLVIVSLQWSSSDPDILVIRSKKDPMNYCFSLINGQYIDKNSFIDTEVNAWKDFVIPRLGICCDSLNGVIWTYGNGKIHEWANNGYPSINLVLDQLGFIDGSFDLNDTRDLISPDEIISLITIQISILSKTLNAQQNASLAIDIGQLLDGSCFKLMYKVLQLAIVNKRYSTIICLLQTLQPLLKVIISKSIKLDQQLIKDLRSVVWRLVCSSAINTNGQIQREACRAFVSGLGVFYPESGEQSALLMVLLSEQDSDGAVMLREMLLHELAQKLVAPRVPKDGPTIKLADDAVSKLIKTCEMESTQNIHLCGSLSDEEFHKFTITQPDISSMLYYISTLVVKTWKDLMMSENCTIDGSLTEMSESITKNVESIMLANKILGTCQKLFEDVSQVLGKLHNLEDDLLALRLQGLEKVIKATPIGQILVFFVTVLTHQKFCSLPVAKGLLAKVSTTTIAAIRTAKLYCHAQAIANQNGNDSDQSLTSFLPDLALWTRSCSVESIHPIRDEYKFTKTVTFKGAKCLYLKFDPRCATQYEYDKVILYAGTSSSGKKIAEYGGNSYGYGSKGVIRLGWPKDLITVNDESVTLCFQVKSTREQNTPDRAVWGFACKVSLKKEEDEKDVHVPLLVDVALGLLYLNYKFLSVLYAGPLSIGEEQTCKHLLNSQLLQRCVWEKTKVTPLQESEACGITITVTPDKDQPLSTTPMSQPRQKLSRDLVKRLRDTSGIVTPTLRPSIQRAIQPDAIEEVILSAVIRHLNLSDMICGLELLQVVEFQSSKYAKLCETMRDVFRRLNGILRQLQAMAEVELRWSQEIDDIRQGLLQPSAAFFNEYHLQEVKCKDLELLCSLKDIVFDPMEQEQVVGKLIQLLEHDAKENTDYDPEDLLSKMPKTKAFRHSLMECGELLCRVTIKSDSRNDVPERSISQGTFSAMNLDNTSETSEDKAALFYRSLSAPPHLHRSLSVQEGAKDLRRLQRWRTAVQRKNKSGHGLMPQSDREVDHGTIVDDIFAFIGSDREKAISSSSFLTAARMRNDRGLCRAQALLFMRELVSACSGMSGDVSNLFHTVASILSQGPRLEELKCGGLVETVREEFGNVIQALLHQTSHNPILYSNSIITLSVCPFSWQEERCVIRSGLITLLDKLCVVGCDELKMSHNLSSMAWASFQVLLDRFVQWEKDQDYRAGAIEWSGLAYQVSSLITNYLTVVLQESKRNNLRTRDIMQHILHLLQSIAKSKMGVGILQQSCTVSTLLTVLLDQRSPPKLLLAVLKLCHVALSLMTESACEQLTLPDTAERYLKNTNIKPVLKVAKLLLMKLGDFVLSSSESEKNGVDGGVSDSIVASSMERDKYEKYTVYVHKRPNQPAHEIIPKIMSYVDQQSNSLADPIEGIDCAVRFDQELTQTNKVKVATNVLMVCEQKASSLAKMGMVTSVESANQKSALSEKEKQLSSSEDICNLRNRKLASEFCRPFVSGQVAQTMASEVISLLQCLMSSTNSDTTTNVWSTAIKGVISDALATVPVVIERLSEDIESSVQYLQRTESTDGSQEDGSPPTQLAELMDMSRKVMAALCVIGGFSQILYVGCKAKITGEDMEPTTCQITNICDSFNAASVMLEDEQRSDRIFEVPLARLELANNQIVSVEKLDLIENTLEALHLLLKTRDVMLPEPNGSHDSSVLRRTSSARILCEMKTRASMVLARQMKNPSFCNVCINHPSHMVQTITHLANDSDPGQRLAVKESQCQELRKVFNDLVKPADTGFKRKTKDLVFDIGREYPPLQGVVFSEGNKVARLVSEGPNLQRLPRGAFIYSIASIPVKAPSFYWEVEVISLENTEDEYSTSGSTVSIGLAPALYHSRDKWSSPIGTCLLHNNGIAVHYKRGGFTCWDTISTGLVLKTNHVLGCGYNRSEEDVDKGTVYFTHNGQLLQGCLNDVKAGLWPVVHLQKKNVKVRVNFGGQPFAYAKGSKIRQAADLVSDSMEEIRDMMFALPFAKVEQDTYRDDHSVPSVQESDSKIKKIPEPLKLDSTLELREYDPSASLTYMLISSCDVMADTGPPSQVQEDEQQNESLKHKTANLTELLVKAWEEKVFPVIRRRFRNESDRRSGLEQIRGALQAGLMDIAIATLEDLYEDNGGIPNSLTLPRLEDVKENANKMTISNIRQGMGVAISTSLVPDPSMAGFAVPEMKKTSGLNGIVISVDKTNKLVEVQTYNREEGNLMRFWYPVSILEKPTSGFGRSSLLAMRSDDTTQIEAQQELLRCEKDLVRLYCREALIDTLKASAHDDDSLTLVRTLSSHVLLSPYFNGNVTSSSIPTVSSPRDCLSLAQLLPSVIFFSKPQAIFSEIQQLFSKASLVGEDELFKLINTVCQSLKDPLKYIWHREFVVSHENLEEEVHFSDAAITIVTCRENPAVHNGWVNSKSPLVSVLCYYGGPVLSKSGSKARYKAVQYPMGATDNPDDQTDQFWIDKYPCKVLPTNRVVVRYENKAVEGPIVDLYGFSCDVLLALVYIEYFVKMLSNCKMENGYARSLVFNVIETVSIFLLKTDLPPVIKEIVFHLLAQLLRVNHELETAVNSVPSYGYTTQLMLTLTRLGPLKTELQKLLNKEVSVTSASALEFILKGNFENDKFTSYLQALFELVLATAEVTPLTRERSESKRNLQGSLTDGLHQAESGETQDEVVISPANFTFASFDYKSDSEVQTPSPLTSPIPLIPHIPRSTSRSLRRGSLRKRKRAHVQEVVSPTESMPWFDTVVNLTLQLRHLLHTHDLRGFNALYDSLSAVVSTKSSNVIHRLLVITNIPQTLTKLEVLDAIQKACKSSGGVFKERTYLPEIPLHNDGEPKEQEDKKGNWESFLQLLPSAQANKPRHICGYSVIELRNSNQIELARQAISALKLLREPGQESSQVGIAKVNADLLMEGTNELEAFAVFDEFLGETLYQDKQFKSSALDALTEIFNSCSIANIHAELGRETPSVLSRSESPVHSKARTPENLEEVTKSGLPEDKTVTNKSEPIKKESRESPDIIDQEVQTQNVDVTSPEVEPSSILVENRENKPYSPVVDLMSGKESSGIISRLTSTPQSLTEDNICNVLSSNLLLTFFQSFCHSKQTIQNLVRQVLQDYGSSGGEDQHPCLTVDGFIEWVKYKAADNIRVVWKAILACGYDLQFQRCTYIFAMNVLEDHGNWSVAKDKALVSFVDFKCRLLSTSPSRLMPDELFVTQTDLASEQYSLLQDMPLLSIRSRFAFLKSINQSIEQLLLPMANLRVFDTHSLSTASLLKMASGLMFYDTKMAFLNRTLDHSSQRNSSNTSPEISLDPLETLEADKVSSLSGSQFHQAANYLSTVTSAGLRVKVASGGDPTFPLRIQLRGEQVLGSGGSFRHFMWLMARELQSQHVNLLIPCPSTAANKNKGMLILKPGPMSYTEEKLLVFFGQLLGIALRSDIPFAVDLMPVFWKSLLGMPLDQRADLQETDVLTYNYIRRFSEVENIEEFTTLCYEADLCPYRFVYTSLNGQEVELCPDGINKPVTWENHREYVDSIRELRLKELRCESRMVAIRCGLYSVIPLHQLYVLQPSDLQKRTCGIPHLDLDFLKAHTTYVAGVKEIDAHIEFFWNTLESFSQDQLCKFVKFACNQERLPSTCTCQKGTPSTADVHVPPYPMKIGPPDGTGRSDARYIRVETCMFMIKLPQYSTQEITNQKLLYAINCREDPLTDI